MDRRHVGSVEPAPAWPRTRIVVKFADSVQAAFEDVGATGAGRLRDEARAMLADSAPGVEIAPLFGAGQAQRIAALVSRARDLDTTYVPPRFSAYSVVSCPAGADAASVVARLRAWDAVDEAYVEGPPAPPPIDPTDDPLFANQGYLKKAPDGIDAEYAWTLPGGAGDGIAFLDVEQGWLLTHEDLAHLTIPLLWGKNATSFEHGTATLGVVVAGDNAIGGIGIAPRATASVVSEYNAAGTFDRPGAIAAALDAVQFGDVLLLESQTVGKLPAETEKAVFDLIRLGTALGVVVVEPAGNGMTDLDHYTNSAGKRVLDRASTDFADSGAVVVGGAKSATSHERWFKSNYGSRVDCFAWAESVQTCTTDTTASVSSYTASFDGTSSASAIIAGAAVVVQGMAEATLQRRLSAWQLRALLGTTATGTPAGSPPLGDSARLGDPGIGVMPDLKAIAGTLLITPDVYVRDFVGDSGDPHVGAINASPDVILRSAKVASGQQAFGHGSGTEDSLTLSEDVTGDADRWVYVRVRNRGSVAAADVVATVYWAPVATLITPDKWKEIGSVTIPTVPAHDITTVSDPIPWPKAKLPPPGHYCFVAVVGNDDDPTPPQADLATWDGFCRLVRSNNNVTWRNFNIIPVAPTPPSGAVELPFHAAGDPESARVFGFEIVAGLPADAEVWWAVPDYLVDLLGLRSPHVHRERRGISFVPINPHGRTHLGEATVPGNTAIPMALTIRMPPMRTPTTADVHVSQLYRGEEIGRVTWRFVPPERSPRGSTSPPPHLIQQPTRERGIT